MKKILPFAIIPVFAFLCYHFLTVARSVNYTDILIAGKNIKAELAVSNEEKEKGLSGRAGLRDDAGMLFVFEQPGKYHFWMKDMNFPIDMIWLGDDMKVIYIKEDARPESYPAVYGPDQDAKYVLEVASGFSEKNNLKLGTQLYLHIKEL